jgi:hypothetical protein
MAGLLGFHFALQVWAPKGQEEEKKRETQAAAEKKVRKRPRSVSQPQPLLPPPQQRRRQQQPSRALSPIVPEARGPPPSSSTPSSSPPSSSLHPETSDGRGPIGASQVSYLISQATQGRLLKKPKPRPPSGFYGVSAAKKRWRAQIFYDGKQYRLGTFDTKQEAALAYDRREARQCRSCLLNYESIAAAEEAAEAAATSA